MSQEDEMERSTESEKEVLLETEQPNAPNSNSNSTAGIWGKRAVVLFLLTASFFYLFISDFSISVPSYIYDRDKRQCNTSSKLPEAVPADTKVILFWTKFFVSGDIPYLHDKMAACPDRKCLLTDDRRYAQVSSAIVFHVRDDLSASDLPTCRTAEQLYVFFLLESPEYILRNLKKAPWPGFFNLTWTYRRDSDIFNSFYMEKYKSKLWTNVTEATESLKKKKDRAIVFASHCPTASQREDYIAELQRYFPVDIGGSCGPGLVSCPRSDRNCEQKLISSYKFYLSFENSYCKDYVTEKSMRPLEFESLPIVYGAANYSLFLPPKSFINTADFASPKVLAAYLRNLTRSPLEYAQYFQWKFNAKFSRITDKMAQPEVASTCALCSLLHNRSSAGKPFHKWYDDIHKWWVEEADCSVPRWTSSRKWQRSNIRIADDFY